MHGLDTGIGTFCIYSSALNRFPQPWYVVELHNASTFGDALLCKERGDVGFVKGVPYGFNPMKGLLLLWKIWWAAN